MIGEGTVRELTALVGERDGVRLTVSSGLDDAVRRLRSPAAGSPGSRFS